VNYLLDTNAVIALLKNNPPGVRNRLRRVVSEGASIAVPSLASSTPRPLLTRTSRNL